MIGKYSRWWGWNFIGKSFLASDLFFLFIFIVFGSIFKYSGNSLPEIWHISPEMSIPSLVLFLKWIVGALFCFLAFCRGVVCPLKSGPP